MDFTYAATTDIGRKRLHNEDAYCADLTLGLYVVCDGMGGHQAGEVASALAIETMQKHLLDAAQNPALPLVGPYDAAYSMPTNRLASAVRLANERINVGAQQEAQRSGMGTTVVSVLTSDHLLSIAHVGDSRLYLIRDGQIRQLTTDHTVVGEQLQQGLISPEDAARSHQRHVLTRAVGVDTHVAVELNEVPLLGDDRFILCSDGLVHALSSDRILEEISRTDDLQHACDALVQLANHAGGLDNITIVVLAVHGSALSTWRRWWRRLVG